MNIARARTQSPHPTGTKQPLQYARDNKDQSSDERDATTSTSTPTHTPTHTPTATTTTTTTTTTTSINEGFSCRSCGSKGSGEEVEEEEEETQHTSSRNGVMSGHSETFSQSSSGNAANTNATSTRSKYLHSFSTFAEGAEGAEGVEGIATATPRAKGASSHSINNIAVSATTSYTASSASSGSSNSGLADPPATQQLGKPKPTSSLRSASSWRSRKSTLRNGTEKKKQNQKQVQYQETSVFDTPSSSSSFSTSSSSHGQGEVGRKLSTQRRNSSDLHSTSSGWSAPFCTGTGRTLSFSPPPAPKLGPRKKGLQRVASSKILSRFSKLSLASPSPSPSLNITQSSIGDRDSSRPTSIPEEELVSQCPDDTNDMNPPEAATNGQHDGAYSSKPTSGAATEAATGTSTSTNIATRTVATRRKSGIASLASWRPSTIFKRFGKSKKQNRDGKKQQKNHQASQERLRDDDHTESRSVKEAVSQRQKNPTTHASTLFSGSSSSSSLSSSQNPTPMNHHNAHRTAAARLVTGHIVRREPETERKVVVGSIRTHHRQHRFPRRHTAGEMESSRESESYTQTEVHAEATTSEASTVLLTEAERKAIEQKRAETLAVLAARAGSETVAKLILAVSDKAENMVKEAEERAYSSSSAVNRATRLPNMLNRLVRRSSSSSSSSRQSRRSRGESGSSSITDFDPRQNPVNFQISPAEARKAFDGSSEPKIGLDRYLCRLVRYLDAYHEQQPGENSVGIRCLLIAMMYIERLCNTVPQFALTRLNVHRLFMVGTLVAAKMEEDDHCSNDYWSGVGGVEVVEINHLEGSFCKYMKFDLVVFPTELAAFYQVYGRGILPSNFVLGTPDTCDREGSR